MRLEKQTAFSGASGVSSNLMIWAALLVHLRGELEPDGELPRALMRARDERESHYLEKGKERGGE